MFNYCILLLFSLTFSLFIYCMRSRWMYAYEKAILKALCTIIKCTFTNIYLIMYLLSWFADAIHLSSLHTSDASFEFNCFYFS